jgi:hypothetical protein
VKVKKFDNLWTMGLIICGGLILILYLAKLIFPNWVVGVAECEPVVKFGEYVDTHWLPYYIFNYGTSFLGGYFYICASCRKKYLSRLQNIIYSISLIFMFVVQKLLPDYFIYLNLIYLMGLSCLFCYLEHNKEIKYLYSCFCVFSIHSVSQILSLKIRDISALISSPNSATFTILLIDSYIWLILTYNYHNYKEENNNG